ncbi:MAG: class I SAM-dependent methyltransferase [Euryarchaeota archaeon]|nr:class I SAM-dependent methyltransferase [Euryarchaeota archaeon]
MGDDHYFTERPASAPRPGVIKAFLRGRNFVFHTSSGVFSRKGIDRGTRLLIDNMVIGPDARVLDLGCGYGVLGIVAAALAPEGEVVLTDVNRRAVKLARRNLRENGIKNAEVRQGDLYAPVEGEVFDVILCNLPMSAGLETVFRIIRQARGHMEPGGTLQVVVRKGHKRVGGEMEEVFGNCRTLARKAGYRVLASEKDFNGQGKS